ncbi:hypothetical protein M378DRAFT_165359 [Amanita muscaria Koide BX008]|uniref:Uncharacterized protein n=1 Tax=Amanita muscaria (strain Koide BX008) TaxID=946122 RepID=A0A0C2X0P1_AMAMK|nr:hypothetical protein M378DRAFT_165359 [Amanita muscaria Koide BX008]
MSLRSIASLFHNPNITLIKLRAAFGANGCNNLALGSQLCRRCKTGFVLVHLSVCSYVTVTRWKRLRCDPISFCDFEYG